MIFLKKTVSKKQVSLMLADLGILAVAPFVAIYIDIIIEAGFRFKFRYMRSDNFYYLMNMGLFVAVFYIMDLYNFKKNFATKLEMFNIFLAICFAWALSVFIFYMSGHPPLGRSISLIYLTTLFILIAVCRIVYSKVALLNRYTKKAIIIGAAKGGEAVANLIKTNPQLNIKIECFLEIDRQKSNKYLCDAPVVCKGDNIIDAVLSYSPDLVIVAMRKDRYEKKLRDLIHLSHKGIEIRDITSIYEEVAGKIPLKYVSNTWLLYSHINQSKFYFYRLKRMVDIISAFILLVASMPIMLLTAIVIKLDSKGPVYYKQIRVGKDGKEFELIKFRSMIQNAEKDGAVWAIEKDQRVTRIGKILRKLRIDELPQLLNILDGEMSFVGPRPERPEFVKIFLGEVENKNEMIPHYGERLTVKPGLTGWAQVMFSYASSYKESWEKMEYDLYYIKNMSLLLDFLIILKTIRVVIFSHGAK